MWCPAQWASLPKADGQPAPQALIPWEVHFQGPGSLFDSDMRKTLNKIQPSHSGVLRVLTLALGL